MPKAKVSCCVANKLETAHLLPFKYYLSSVSFISIYVDYAIIYDVAGWAKVHGHKMVA